MQDASTFGEKYATMSDDELLRLASQKDSLLPVAQEVLMVEMQKRGLNDAAVATHRRAEAEASQREGQETKSDKERRSKRRLESLVRLGILVAAILTDWLVTKMLGLSSEVIYFFTQMSLYSALGLFVVTTFVGAWWTLKRTIVLVAGFSLWLGAWIIYTVATAHPH